jgi:hypothetical protein
MMRNDPDPTCRPDEDARASLCDTCWNSFLPDTRSARSSACVPGTPARLGRRTILKILGALPAGVLLWWYGPKGSAKPGKRAMFSRKIG